MKIDIINKKIVVLTLVGILALGVVLFFKDDIHFFYYKATHSGMVEWHNIKIDLPENYLYGDKFPDESNKLYVYNPYCSCAYDNGTNYSCGGLYIQQRNIKGRTAHDILDIYNRAFPSKILESKEINFKNQKVFFVTHLSEKDSDIRELTFIFQHNLVLQVVCSEKAHCRAFDQVLERISFKE